MANILNIPPEIIIHILQFMDDKTFIIFTNTNKQLQKFKKEKILENWYSYYKVMYYANIYNFSSITHITNSINIKVFPKLKRIKIYRSIKIKDIPDKIKIEYLDDLFSLQINYSNPLPNQYSDYFQPWQIGISY